MSETIETEAPQSSEGAVTIEKPSLSQLTGEGKGDNRLSMDLLADVALPVTVELGRATMKIGDLMGLSNGSVVGLDRDAGEPVDLLVRGVPFARGEVVVLGERYGLRITSLAGGDGAAKAVGGRG
jgi:flagellar motor switch protein FliN/FliY